jgi:competence ComEA-like helix-hairpin-helix protein
MAERVSEPPIAWYQLTRVDLTVIFSICFLLLSLCFILVLDSRPDTDLPVESWQAPPARLNVNTASAAELTVLPGVGQSKAARIVEARKQGPIRNMEELAAAAGGLPAAAMDRMKTFVAFDEVETTE